MTPADATMSEPTPVGQLSYEQARDELVALVSRIESGQVPLEESMLLWERGEQLATHCQAKLDSAQETLDRATARGSVLTPEDVSAGGPTDGSAGGSTDDSAGGSTDDSAGGLAAAAADVDPDDDPVEPS